MIGDFFFNIAIITFIFFLLASGFKFFLNLKSELDFSYLAIIIFASYVGVIANNLFSFGILSSLFFAFFLSLPFTLLVLYLSSRLSEIYFVIGSLALYMIAIQFARNLDITGGARGISILSRNVLGELYLGSPFSYLIFIALVSLIIGVFLWYMRKTYFYKGLTAWGEKELVLKSLGLRVGVYKLFMIILTTFLASLGGNLYSFFYMYIDPLSFWLSLLSPILIVSLISYRFKEIGTLIITFFIIFMYEGLRFAKFVPDNQIGFFREMLFGLLIMITAFLVFRRTDFGREI